MTEMVACVDFGSTYTKALLVSTGDAEVVAGAEATTTSDTDVMRGWLACRDQLLVVEPGVRRAPVLACSSAGGGLRIAVVGNEELVTAEAARRVALSSGGTVVYVGVGGLIGVGLEELRAAAPDVVLLVGGTDDGNAEVIVAAARQLAADRWSGPVVIAGNRTAAAQVSETFAAAGVDHQVADNVVPRIGVLRPEPARAAIRAMFLRHVIGGKRLSASADFLAMVVSPTPDVVLDGVELLAECAGDIAVVDVGGATTDVYSVVEVDPEEAGGLDRRVIATTPVNRTVEGDLGVRSSAESTAAAAREAGLVASGNDQDRWLATLAIGLALRRHAGRKQVVFGPDGRLIESTGTDLREVGLIVGSGGALRHTSRERAVQALRLSTGLVDGGWLLPRAPRFAIDSTYVLAAAGLLRENHRAAAGVLVDRYIVQRAHP